MRIEVLNGNPRIFATPEALQMMQAYTDISIDEIGWLGNVEALPNNTYLITDVFLVEQTVGAATCELKPEAILALCEEKIMRGEDVSKMKLWGHSHVNMGVSPSYQDEIQFRSLYANANDFFIRLIMNKKDEMNISFIDLKHQIIYHEMPISLYAKGIIDKQAIEREIDKKVSKMPVVVYPALRADEWEYDNYYNSGNHNFSDGFKKIEYGKSKKRSKV